MKRVLVTGAGGFIGTHLVEYLVDQGYWVRGADLKYPEWSDSPANEFYQMDLRDLHNCHQACADIDWVFHLAADMGGMGFITSKQADIIKNNTKINSNMLDAARVQGVSRFLFSSSACVYPVHLQDCEQAILLKESDAYPALPQESYGWEKLHMEHLCAEYRKAGWLNTWIVRFHNCYGSLGAYDGGREKAPAAMARKAAIAKITGNHEIEIWGDGEQSRSFMHVDDCVVGLLRLIQSDDFHGPVNFGRDRCVTINELVEIVENIAGIKCERKYIKGPQGVRSRNSDNSLCKEKLNWSPGIPLETGMINTYEWIYEQVKSNLT